MIKKKTNIQSIIKGELSKIKNTKDVNLIDKIQTLETIFFIENKSGEVDLKSDKTVKIPVYDEYTKIKQESNTLRFKNKDYAYAIEKARYMDIVLNPLFMNNLCKVYTNNQNYENIIVNSIDNININDNNNNIKNYTVSMSDHFFFKEYKGNNVLKKMDINNKINIRLLDLFKNGDNLIFMYLTFSNKNIPIIELYSIFFKKVIILGHSLIICLDYQDNKKNIIKKIIENNYKFNIDYDKNTEDKIKKFYNNYYKIFDDIYNNFIKTKDENKYILNRYYLYINILKSIGIENKKNDIALFYINLFKLKIYSKDDFKKIESNINSREGKFISKIIKKYNFKKCIEVGFAHGISSIYILQNKDTTLISIDPFQKSDWDNEGLKFVKHLGYDKNHSLIEKKSHIALPELLIKNGEESFDFIFIDGDHKFDITLLDFYYSSLLVKKGGIIIIDDVLHHGVNKCIKFIDTNMKNFKKLNSTPTIGVYKKTGEDKREWFYHQNF